MPTITLCTFNVENLFGRYKVFGFLPGDKYKRKILSKEELQERGGFLPGHVFAPKNSFEIFDNKEWRGLTAQALKGKTEDYPDIACLQEVESMQVLRLFNEKYLAKNKKPVYPYVLLIDSHDPRLIDIGVLSKHRIVDLKNHMDEPYDDKSGYLFSRDCLEVTFEIAGKSLTLFINHLKSKFTEQKDKKGDEERKKANEKRKAQAVRVAEIVRTRFGENNFSSKAFAVVGDFNDTPDSEYVKPLAKDLGLENVISSRITDKKEQWTHWWEGKNIVSQIDYILLSPRLANDSKKDPYIERKGISTARKKSHLAGPGDTQGEEFSFDFLRFTGVTDKIAASDHCPVFMELEL